MPNRLSTEVIICTIAALCQTELSPYIPPSILHPPAKPVVAGSRVAAFATSGEGGWRGPHPNLPENGPASPAKDATMPSEGAEVSAILGQPKCDNNV